MNHVPVQIGVLVDSTIGYSAGIGPIVAVVGLGILTVWYLDTQILPTIESHKRMPRTPRTVVLFGTVIGLILTVSSIVLQTGYLWLFSLIYLFLGKFIEAAVAVRIVRRVQAAIRSIRDPTSAGQMSLIDILKYLYSPTRIVAGVVIPAVGIGVIVVYLLDNSLQYALGNLSVIWTVTVGVLAVSGLLWDIRLLIRRSGGVQYLGLVFCVMGAELYSFSNLPPWIISTVETILAWMPVVRPASLTQNLIVNTALIFVAQVAFLIGVGIALLLLFSREARGTRAG